MEYKPCPFCQNPNAPEGDSGDACCFCDYEGSVGIGHNGMFHSIEQYNKVFYAANHQDRLDELHGRNSPIKIEELLTADEIIEKYDHLMTDSQRDLVKSLNNSK